MTSTSRFVAAAFVAVLLVCAQAAPARAQGFIAPFIGYTFGGDAACPTLQNCDSKSPNFGVAFGTLNKVIGFEEEFAYAKNFFDDPTVTNSSVLTLMSNVIIGPRIGIVRPYGAGGFGLMKSHVELEPSSILSVDNNDLGWNIGGGLIIQAGHIGVRGDVRFFHGFTDLDVLGFKVSDLQLNYGRASAGVVFSY